MVHGELVTPTLSTALPTSRIMLAPTQPQSLGTGGWVTVPAEPHGVGRDKVSQSP